MLELKVTQICTKVAQIGTKVAQICTKVAQICTKVTQKVGTVVISCKVTFLKRAQIVI